MDGDRAAPTGATLGLSGDSASDAPRTPHGVGEDFRLEMPVELWFGDHHVGVKAESDTCAAFRRFADAILADYHAAIRAPK